MLQYGYGSYGYSADPYFSLARLSLLDRGFVYAIAHIRGGQEMGRRWYDQGRLLNKVNTFTDFIDVTRFLVQERYADPKRVSAMGGSAGFGRTLSVRHVMARASKTMSRPTRLSPMPHTSLTASVAMTDPTLAHIAPRTPPTAQEGTASGGGCCGNTQA